MALTTYTELKASVADWLARADLTAVIPDFITLAEQRIRRDLRKRLLVGSVTLTPASGSFALAAAIEELVTLALNTASFKGPMDVGTMMQVRDMLDSAPTGLPRIYAVVDSSVYLAPVPDSAYTLTSVYREALIPLSGSVASNSTLARSPDIYLYASLLEAAPYLEHDTRIPIWQAKLDQAIESENAKREREELGAAPLVARLPVVF